jgi:hypothetical protein
MIWDEDNPFNPEIELLKHYDSNPTEESLPPDNKEED